MNNFKENESVHLLCEAFAKLTTAEDFLLVLEDLCTVQEIDSLSQRLTVASLLDKGTNYTEVTKQTGASSATISRVNKCLNYGAGGYRLLLDSVGKNDN